jgi:decaprenylphospho-beta-D-erythro-pentofuranosid-2-ulose 2-reductase
MMKILVIGATSAMAQATARIWAAQGHRIFLAGRHDGRLQAITHDLRARGAELAASSAFVAEDFGSHGALVDEAFASLGGLDLVLVAHGALGDQKACESDFAGTAQAFTTNALSVMSILTHVANRFQGQRQGTIVVIGSVAGDRGRKSNYVYGSAKAAVEVFVQGIRNRLHAAGVHVMLVKPGLVDTPMTEAFAKGPLWAAPETVALCITEGVTRRRNVVYAPSFWWMVMAVIRAIPEPLFKRLSL